MGGGGGGGTIPSWEDFSCLGGVGYRSWDNFPGLAVPPSDNTEDIVSFFIERCPLLKLFMV